jgi:rubrerythrin
MLDGISRRVVMAELAGSQTHANLADAFSAESQSNQRYVWFAEQADVEGRPDMARLFRALAEGGTTTAHGHLEYLAQIGDPASGFPIGDTDDNLRAAIENEKRRSAQSYPDFAGTARAEGFTEVADWFDTIANLDSELTTKLAEGLEDA